MKFTTTGVVSVAATVVAQSGGNVDVSFEVRDSGPGIPPDRLGTIFDPFVQAHSGREGTGLGLAISDRLVTLMGGHFKVESTVGEGSSFRFAVRFPEVSEPREGGEAAPAAAEPAVHSDVVLVVDDSPASRTRVLRQLSRLGVEAVVRRSPNASARRTVARWLTSPSSVSWPVTTTSGWRGVVRAGWTGTWASRSISRSCAASSASFWGSDEGRDLQPARGRRTR